MKTSHKRLSVSAFPDGNTYIVWINEIDERGRETDKQQIIEGVMAESEEDAINKVIEAITRSVYAQMPDATVTVSPITAE